MKSIFHLGRKKAINGLKIENVQNSLSTSFFRPFLTIFYHPKIILQSNVKVIC